MAKINKSMNKRLLNREKGQTYILVLVFMLIGTLLITPLLSFMSSGLSNTLKYQNRTHELYAANAGVREAVWNLKTGKVSLTAGGILSPLPLQENDDTQRPNARPIDVSIFCMDKNQIGGIYKVAATATTPHKSSTTIEAWVETRPFLMDYAIITPSTLTSTSNGSSHPEINGSVAGDVTGFTGVISGRIDEPWDASQWPFNVLSTYYYGQAYATNTTYGPTIDAGSGVVERRAGISHGDLEFTGNGGTLRLTGTIYVEGNLDLAKNHDFTLDLNSQTIYVTGDIYAPPGKPTITGSGCIIAAGDINFQPMMANNPDDYIFVMSTLGEVNFQPGGDYYGTVAGKVNIHLSPSNTITHTDPPLSLNFPGAFEGINSAVHIITWNISPPYAAANTLMYITTDNLSYGVVGTPYSQSLATTGGTPDYTYTIDSGALPDGLTLTTGGLISGTPAASGAGISGFVVRATDAGSRTAIRSFTINILSSPPQQLAVATGAATNITNQSATLNGSLTNMGAAYTVSVSFEYGLTPTTIIIPVAGVPSSLNVPNSFIANMTGLAASTTYYYRAVARAGAEVVYGDNKTFTTSSTAPMPPEVNTVSVTLSSSSKTFSVLGRLVQLGSATNATLWVKWDRNAVVPADESSGWVAASPTSTTSDGTDFSLNINSPYGGSGKWPAGYTYYFRVKAIGNNGQIVYGAEISYTN